MANFIQDMKKATELFNKWTEDHAIFDADFQIIDKLLQKHYDERNALFEIMLKILEDPEDDGLVDNWRKVCEHGLDLLERLDDAIPSRVGDGLKSIGLDDFAEGEKKIWEENHEGAIPRIAEAITDLAETNEELIEKLEEDLKKAREEAQGANELVRVTFGEMNESALQLVRKAVEEAATEVVSEIPLIGKRLAEAGGKFRETALGGSEKIRDAAKRKRAFKEILVANREKIEALKREIDDESIQNARKQGYAFADSLKGVGATGDYGAVDWESFAKECRERLEDRSEPAIAQAQDLYKRVHPAYIEGLTGAYANIASDPASLEAFKGELDENIKAVFEAFKKDKEVVNLLRAGSQKTYAWQEIEELERKVTEAVKELKDKIKSAEEEMLVG